MSGVMPRLVLAALLSASPAASAQSAEPTNAALGDVNAPEYSLSEKGCIGARVLDYLDRHGDYGVIDSEALLYLTTVEHERLTRERRERSVGAQSIDGTWRSIGPENGAGRAVAVAVHPSITGTVIVGAAGGGAWKTTDAGLTWTPLTDTLANLSVGAVAYAPSNANRVYLGTGEGGYAFDFIPGIGFLTSQDGGQTWNLPSSVVATKFYRINVHPANADELVIGTNEGAHRSTDGGQTWTAVIPVRLTSSVTKAYGDVTDIVRDPGNPAVLYAATWDRGLWCAARDCTYPDIFASPTVLKSTDGGVNWSPAAAGLPVSTSTLDVERMSLAISPSNPSVLYLLTATTDGSGVATSRVFKTTDGGGSWSETSLSTNSNRNVRELLGTQGWYDTTIVVHPADPSVVIAGGIRYARTADGGTTWTSALTSGSVHVDAHDLRYDAAGTLWIANDGGIWISADHGLTGVDRNRGLVTRQYYAMAQDAINRDRILGGTQDNGTNYRRDGAGTNWVSFSGGDGFQCLIHPDAPSVAFSSFQFAAINRTYSASATAPSLASFSPIYPSDETEPFFSILKADPSAPSTIYTATTRVWKSTTAGSGWVPLPTTVTEGTWNTRTVRALAIAPSNPAVLAVAKGSVVYRSSDGGATWSLIGNGLPGRTVTNIEFHPQTDRTMFATIAGTSGPSLYMTSNAGATWSASANGLPSFSALVVRVDVTDPGVLYAGTDVGVYRSTDGGANWSRFGSGLPAVSVYDIQMFGDGSLIRAATHGRGMWELGSAPPAGAVVAIAPASPVTIARGTTVSFAGSVSHPNGTPFTARWAFPDDWTIQEAGATSTVRHTFDRAGWWPVTLSATDRNGVRSAAEVRIAVTELGDDCASPIVVPSSGPFPWSITLNGESATRQTLSDPQIGGSCYQFTASRTFWFSFTPAESGSYSFSLCGSRVAAFVAGYSGASCGPYTALPMCTANTTLGTDCSKDPSSSMDLQAGTTYRFHAGTYFLNNYGDFTVTVNRGTASQTVIRSVAPATGPAGGGTSVTITGLGFASGSVVRFGGIAARQVTVISPTVITAVTPASAYGPVDVTVESGKGAVVSAGAFTFVTPPSGSRRRSIRH